MRIAVLSDIHGNLPALEAVLAEVARAPVDCIVNLGDMLSGPLWPAETAARLMALDWPTIAGNHERQLLTLPLECMSATDAHTIKQLGAAQRAWLAALPPTRWLDDEVFCCHGTPGSVGLQAYDDTQPHLHRVEQGSPHARWALAERGVAGQWRIEQRLTPYDWCAAAAQAERHGRGDWADALRTGLVGRMEQEIFAR